MKIKNKNFSPNTKIGYKFTRPVYKNGDYADYFGYLIQIYRADAIYHKPDTLQEWGSFYATIQALRIAGLVEAIKFDNNPATLRLTQEGIDYIVYHIAKNNLGISLIKE